MNEALLAELRATFREASRGRLADMEALLTTIENDPADGAAVTKLAHHFHGLAGVGAMYGYPSVSSLGDEGEGSMIPILRSGTTPSPATVAEWRDLVEQINRELCY